MKLNRTKNSLNNILLGSMNRITWVLIPFVLRTMVIYYLGEEYLGINSLFISILSVLNLTELGLGNAIIASMYEPIAKDDTNTICALMGLYRKLYRIIGTIVLILGLCLIPFLSLLVGEKAPTELNIYLLYLIYLSLTVIPYFLFGYKQILLSVHQRQDIVFKISMITKIFICILQSLVIVFLKNMYLYVMLNVAHVIIINCMCANRVSKKYPYYNCKGAISKELKNQIYKKTSGLFIQKIGQVLSIQLDIVIISIFLDIVFVARFSNYSFIVTSIGSLMLNFFSSMTAGIGNCMALETKEKVYKLFLKVFFVGSWLVSWCAICLFVLLQPFVNLWLGPEMMLDDTTAWLFVIYFYISYKKHAVITFKDAAGLWWEDKWKPLVAGLVNLVLNIILIHAIGLNGVIISTIASYVFVEIPWETYTLFKYYFVANVYPYYKQYFYYFIIVLLVGYVTACICSYIPLEGVLSFIIKCCICVVVPNAMFAVIYYKKREFCEVIQIAKNTLEKRMR